MAEQEPYEPPEAEVNGKSQAPRWRAGWALLVLIAIGLGLLDPYLTGSFLGLVAFVGVIKLLLGAVVWRPLPPAALVTLAVGVHWALSLWLSPKDYGGDWALYPGVWLVLVLLSSSPDTTKH